MAKDVIPLAWPLCSSALSLFAQDRPARLAYQTAQWHLDTLSLLTSSPFSLIQGLSDLLQCRHAHIRQCRQQVPHGTIGGLLLVFACPTWAAVFPALDSLRRSAYADLD